MRWALDNLYDWIVSQLDNYVPDMQVWLAFPLTWLAISLAISLSRWVSYAVITRIVFPAALAFTVVSHALLLTAEFLCTQMIRALSLRPPHFVYRFGEILTDLKPVLMQQLRVGATRSELAFARRRARAWSVLIVLLLGWWNSTYCAIYTNSADCAGPPSAWAQSVNGAVREFAGRLGL